MTAKNGFFSTLVPIHRIRFTLLALIALTLSSACGKNNLTTDTSTTLGSGGYTTSSTSGIASNCSAVTGPLSFQGSFNATSSSVVSSASAASGSTVTGAATLSGSGSDAWITLQLQMTGTNTAAGAGQIQLTSLYLQALQYEIQTGRVSFPGYSGYAVNLASLCATVSSINLTRSGTKLYGGQIQLLLNGSIPMTVYF